jgi:Flp pilus assembly secretin CpaC
MSELGPYAAADLRERLVSDERVGEQDVHVAVVAGRIVITGSVATEARRDAISEVATEVVGRDHRNLVTVVRADGPVVTEHLS